MALRSASDIRASAAAMSRIAVAVIAPMPRMADAAAGASPTSRPVSRITDTAAMARPRIRSLVAAVPR